MEPAHSQGNGDKGNKKRGWKDNHYHTKLCSWPDCKGSVKPEDGTTCSACQRKGRYAAPTQKELAGFKDCPWPGCKLKYDSKSKHDGKPAPSTCPSCAEKGRTKPPTEDEKRHAETEQKAKEEAKEKKSGGKAANDQSKDDEDNFHDESDSDSDSLATDGSSSPDGHASSQTSLDVDFEHRKPGLNRKRSSLSISDDDEKYRAAARVKPLRSRGVRQREQTEATGQVHRTQLEADNDALREERGRLRRILRGDPGEDGVATASHYSGSQRARKRRSITLPGMTFWRAWRTFRGLVKDLAVRFRTLGV